MLYLEYFMADKHYVAWFCVLVAFYGILGFAHLLTYLEHPNDKIGMAKTIYLKIGPVIFLTVFSLINFAMMDSFYKITVDNVKFETTVKGSIYHTSYDSDGSVVNKIISGDGVPKICDIKFDSYGFNDIEFVDKEFVPPQNQKYYIVHDLKLNDIKCDGAEFGGVSRGTALGRIDNRNVELNYPRLIVTEEQKKELLSKQENVLEYLKKNHEKIMLNRIKSAKNSGKVFLD